MVRMKSLARMHVWWPKIDEHIVIIAFPVNKIQESQQNHQFLHRKTLQTSGNAFILILQDLLKDQCGL